MELKDLYGEHILTGVDFGHHEITEGYCKGETANTVDFILDGKIYSAIEDPEDGYRSSMGEIMEGRISEIRNTFPPLTVVGVEMPRDEYGGTNEAVDFFDKVTGKVVLFVGTGDFQGYYPFFIAQFHPENMVHNRVGIIKDQA